MVQEAEYYPSHESIDFYHPYKEDIPSSYTLRFVSTLTVYLVVSTWY
ncbi:hypothetical protein [Enterococcus viikkiensis]